MQHRRRGRNRELILALIAVISITIGYLAVAVFSGRAPAAGGFFGHTIGVLGFTLMLMTETLYSLRKRSRSARWGRMASWLDFHIFTGIVGPYMVLLHTSWKFNGLAGALTLLTLVVVASGFIGRYIFTAVPRSADGVLVDATQLHIEIDQVQAGLDQWAASNPEAKRVIDAYRSSAAQSSGSPTFLLLARPVLDLGWRFRWLALKRSMDPATQARAGDLERLLRTREVLRRQVATLAVARRVLSLWHTVHIPIGMVLFTLAFIHMIAGLYYVTLAF